MNEEIKEYTSTEKIKRPSYSLVATWIKESWDAVDINIIRRSFKCCGISNAINGSEDSLIFDFNKVQNINNRRRGIEENGENHDESSDSNYEPDDNSESNSSKCESEDNYYEINEEHNVLQDWR
jgi:hypothetical protein